MGGAAPSPRAVEPPPLELRDAVRRSLTAAPRFGELDGRDRHAIANSLVRIAHAASLLEAEAEADPSRAPPPVARAMNAADQFGGNAVDRMASTTRQMLRAISFPRFVNELITGVFRAMVETNQQQLQQYVELVRGVSQSLEGFSSMGGDDNMAKRWLAERFPQSFTIEEPDPDDVPDPEDGPEPLRLISAGTPPAPEALRAALSLEPHEQVPSGGAQELVPFVRRSLARNRQQMLATMVQMGMQRIVIDSGRVSASMRFNIAASSAAAEQRHTGLDTRTTIGASASGGFGFWSASASVNSTIGYVQTTDTQTREELNASADLASSVELHFRTDQVPLDRIASQQTVQRLQLNTLNPERELQISAETDRARIAASQAVETARAAHPSTPFAPVSPAQPAPVAPTARTAPPTTPPTTTPTTPATTTPTAPTTPATPTTPTTTTTTPTTPATTPTAPTTATTPTSPTPATTSTPNPPAATTTTTAPAPLTSTVNPTAPAPTTANPTVPAPTGAGAALRST